MFLLFFLLEEEWLLLNQLKVVGSYSYRIVESLLLKGAISPSK